MLMFSKILVPVDGSNTSFKALGVAIELSQRIGSQVTVLLVMEDVPKIYIESQKLLDQFLLARTEEGKKILAKCKQDAENKGVTIKTEFRDGNPAQVILEVSKKQGYEMIIMGTRGLGGFKGLVLGSVSNKVAHSSKCSILLVR
jgi:nucleotide-binding universal stress UspA family protein